MADLMNGLVRARSVRMNQEGWTIIKDFKFLRNLSFDQENKVSSAEQCSFYWAEHGHFIVWHKQFQDHLLQGTFL